MCHFDSLLHVFSGGGQVRLLVQSVGALTAHSGSSGLGLVSAEDLSLYSVGLSLLCMFWVEVKKQRLVLRDERPKHSVTEKTCSSPGPVAVILQSFDQRQLVR